MKMLLAAFVAVFLYAQSASADGFEKGMEFTAYQFCNRMSIDLMSAASKEDTSKAGTLWKMFVRQGRCVILSEPVAVKVVDVVEEYKDADGNDVQLLLLAPIDGQGEAWMLVFPEQAEKLKGLGV